MGTGKEEPKDYCIIRQDESRVVARSKVKEVLNENETLKLVRKDR